MKIFFYAFANTSYIFNEVINLSNRREENIEWGLIYPRAVYKDTYPKSIDKNNILYLYEKFDDKYKMVVDDEIVFNDERWIDNIHTIIESSKFGYKTKKADNQLRVVYTIYRIYKDFLLKNRPDAIVFPDIETVNGVLLVNLSKELNIEVMVTAHARQFDMSFFSPDYKETLPIYFGESNHQDILKAETFINTPIKKAIIGNSREEQKIEIKPIKNIFFRMIYSIKNYYKYEKNGIFDTNLYLRIRLNFEHYFELWREWFFNHYQIQFFDITNDNEVLPSEYILLLLQVTPESSINTFERYFIEQERVIDLVRLNMPSNTLLLVKEHPAMRGMRNSSWYKKMKYKSGVKLVTHKVDTPTLVKQSKLVITVTGSVAIECYHMDKPVLMFGKNFISYFVDSLNSFDRFKYSLFNLMNKEKFDEENKKIQKVAKLYNVGYEFFIHEPFHFKQVMTIKNIDCFLNAIVNHLNRLEKATNV